MLVITVNSCFVAPVNLRIFLFRAMLNAWIAFFQSFFNGFRVLLIGPFGGLLWCKTPALQIITDGTNWHLFAILVLNQLHGCLACPQHVVKLDLIWLFVCDLFLKIFSCSGVNLWFMPSGRPRLLEVNVEVNVLKPPTL